MGGWGAGRDDSEGEKWADRWWAEMTLKGRSGRAGRDDSEREKWAGRDDSGWAGDGRR